MAKEADKPDNDGRRDTPLDEEIVRLRATPIPRASPAPGSRRRVAPKEEKEILDERGELTQDLIEIAARDMDRTEEDEQTLAAARKSKPETFYSDLLYTLAHIRYPELEARLVWVNLLTHKAEMSSLLGRNVGIRVAALDFFRNVIGTLQEVTIMDSSEYIQTARLAITDELTAVYNHRYFQDRLAREIERAERARSRVSLLMIDIDHFKRYNDKNGHTAGDVALREVAAGLRRPLDEGDIVARYGGEEFAIILPGAGKKGAIAKAEEVRGVIRGLAIPNANKQPSGRMTISLGVATYPADASDRNGLIDWADLSLYLAKTGGRDRVASCPVDRRRAERSSTDVSARMWPANETEDSGRTVHIVDIGTGGLAFVSETLPHVGARVMLSLSTEEIDRPLQVKGRIAWKRPESRVGNLAGLEFVGLTADSRAWLKKWVLGV